MEQWNIDDVIRLANKRIVRLNNIGEDLELIQLEQTLCREDIFHWVENWVWTFNPQNVGTDFPAWLPFDLFPKQVELIKFFDVRMREREDGICEKSRETGYSWCTVTWATHKWLYVPGFIGTFTANLEHNVDKIGDPKSLFEKVRLLLKFLPQWMLPSKFNHDLHASYMRIINTENGNVLSGAAGEQAGRAGRSTVLFIDEAAFIENAERVDAATSANAPTRIWGSTVNGMGNLFARKRFGGRLRPDQIFRLHWKDDPRKTEEWAKKERSRLEPHIWASEYDLDYTASVEGICIPAKWVDACKEIKHILKQKGIIVQPDIEGISGGDVGGGKARSTVVTRFGPFVIPPVSWGDPDTIETAYRMLDAVEDAQIICPNGYVCKSNILYFDSIAIGRGVNDTLTKNERNTVMTVPVNTGESPSDTVWEDGKSSEEKFANLRAELWYITRDRIKCSYEYLLFLKGETDEDGNLTGIEHTIDELLILPDDSESPECMQLSTELSLPKVGRNERGKIVMERKTAMAKRGIPSTDFADALIMTFVGNGALEIWAKLGA
jgi:phage terminase large subunit